MSIAVRNNLDRRKLIELVEEFGGSHPLDRIVRLVGQWSERVSVLVESDPPESEYRDEYEMFYQHVHVTKGKRSPTRLHFFEGDVPSVKDVKAADDRYRGFCDVRPVPSRSVSCALIDERAFVPEGSRRYLFLICQKEFKVKLGETELKVKAFPYVQQDGQAIRCAQAALASLAMFFGSKHDGKEMTGPAFTKLGADVPVGKRAVPSQGLGVPQIGYGITKMGLDPVVYVWEQAPESMKAVQHREQVIYRYLESGIPVFVVIKTEGELHALVVVGHTFTPDTWQVDAKEGYYLEPRSGLVGGEPAYYCSTDWVERFVVQDDNMGPYTLIRSDFLQYHACELVVAPLPPHIYLPAETAEAFVGWLLSENHCNLCAVLDAGIENQKKGGIKQSEETMFWYGEFRRHVKNREYILRTSLRQSADVKEEMRKEPCAAEYADLLNAADWPARVWQVEVSWPAIFTHGRQRCGKVILDATTPFEKYGLDQSWLWLHLPGVILARDSKTNQMQVEILKGDDGISKHHFNVV